jgi:hypothetical protein
MMIDSSPPHGVSPFGHGTFVPASNDLQAFGRFVDFGFLKGRGDVLTAEDAEIAKRETWI